jgi:hypothetical protein
LPCRLALALALALACTAALLLATPAVAEVEGPPPGDPWDERAVLVQVGPAFVWADTIAQADAGNGALLEGVYVFHRDSWLTPRLYAGLLATSKHATCQSFTQPCEVSTAFVHGGARVRLEAPIPWVAPFLEAGLGLAAGRRTTRIGAELDASGGGLTYTVPFGFGLAVGKRHQYQLGISSSRIPGWHLVASGLTVGFGFAL